ncbi:MAG: hypothetical protein PHX53_05425 [Syntrophales bacterium]|nr:hypothetical protein [Syntrophales bacterium]
MPNLSGLYPQGVLYRHPAKETAILGFLAGEPIFFATWWEALRFLWTLQISVAKGQAVSHLFGFWN